jgi:hypothetical protein
VTVVAGVHVIKSDASAIWTGFHNQVLPKILDAAGYQLGYVVVSGWATDLSYCQSLAGVTPGGAAAAPFQNSRRIRMPEFFCRRYTAMGGQYCQGAVHKSQIQILAHPKCMDAVAGHEQQGFAIPTDALREQPYEPGSNATCQFNQHNVLR